MYQVQLGYVVFGVDLASLFNTMGTVKKRNIRNKICGRSVPSEAGRRNGLTFMRNLFPFFPYLVVDTFDLTFSTSASMIVEYSEA